MTIGATQLGSDGIPLASAIPDGSLAPIPTEAGPVFVDSNGTTLAPVSMYVKDGNNVSQGAKADAAATDSTSSWNIIQLLKAIFARALLSSTAAKQPALGTAGTPSTDVISVQGVASGTAQPVSGTVAANQGGTWTVQPGNTQNTTPWLVAGSKSSNSAAPGATNIGALTGIANAVAPTYVEGDQVLLSTDLAGNTRVSVGNANANGQSTMANSVSTALASDQSSIPVKRASVALFSTTQTTQGSGNSGDLVVGPYTELAIDVNLTAVAGTNPTIQFFYERKGVSDGIYYPVWQSDLLQGLPANPTAISTSIGAGMEWPQSLGSTGRLRWVVGGTATPTYTFTPNVQGR